MRVLEANTFRMAMLMGAIVVVGLFIAFFFTIPVVPVDAKVKDQYEKVLSVDLVERNHITGYEALQFAIQGNARGTIRYY